MKFCPYCTHELSAKTKFCSNCGKALSATAGFLNLPKKFWMTFIGTVGLALLFFLDWITIKIPDFFDSDMKAYGFNLFSINTTFDKIKNLLDNFGVKSTEFSFLRIFFGALLFFFAVGFLLLVVSLIGYRSKNRAAFAYAGFGIITAACSIFIACIFYVNSQVAQLSEGIVKLLFNFTLFPFIALLLSIVALLFFVKRPIIILHSKSASAERTAE